jgi:hypothetical protein
MSRPQHRHYTLLQHDHVLIYEFFMPLTNETTLKQSLDRLFYRDAVLNRLKQLDQGMLRKWFPPEGARSGDYFQRCATGFQTASRAIPLQLSTVAAHGYLDFLKQVNDLIDGWKREGRKTQRNWWDIFARL